MYRRPVPITDDILQLLVKHKAEQSGDHTYVFIPPERYEYIQQLRIKRRWSIKHGSNPLNNFDRQFKGILRHAGIDGISFHDIRRTCLTYWFGNGLKEYDVMNMAGHSNFETTHNFYLGVREDLLDQARLASSKVLEDISMAKPWQRHSEAEKRKDSSA